MTHRKRTLFGGRSNRSDTLEGGATESVESSGASDRPLPLGAWGHVDLPPPKRRRAPPPPPPTPDEEITDGPDDEATDPPARAAPEADPDTEPTEVPDDKPAASPVSTGSSSLVGSRIGQWTVKDLIGQGAGYSLVRVHHHQSERIRATLKVLDSRTVPAGPRDSRTVPAGPRDSRTVPALDDEPTRDAASDDLAARERLVREGEILFPLDHPTIANVKNLMLAHDPPYLEFAQLDGERLDSVLARRHTLFMAEALDLVEQLFGTLAYLHSHEVFHLDLQPANIMVRPDGVITLIGFGHAVERQARRETAPSAALPYLAPEWPDLEWPGLADLYSAGALLFELLTGQAPFGAPMHGGSITTALVLEAKNAAPFLDPGTRFHEDLRAVVRHLTTREPAGRLADPADALSRLQSVARSYAT
ncbi:MAG: protein kinase [Myxococcota bacterium]